MWPNTSPHLNRRCNNSDVLKSWVISVLSIVGGSSAGVCVCGNQMNAFNPERTTEAFNAADGQYDTGLIEQAEIPNGSDIQDHELCPNTVRSLHYITEPWTWKYNYSICHSAAMITFWLAKEVLVPLRQATENILVRTQNWLRNTRIAWRCHK